MNENQPHKAKKGKGADIGQIILLDDLNSRVEKDIRRSNGIRKAADYDGQAEATLDKQQAKERTEYQDKNMGHTRMPER